MLQGPQVMWNSDNAQLGSQVMQTHAQGIPQVTELPSVAGLAVQVWALEQQVRLMDEMLKGVIVDVLELRRPWWRRMGRAVRGWWNRNMRPS